MNRALLIARRDLTDFARGGRLYWAGGLILVLVATSLVVGWQRQRESRAERTRAQALDYGDWIRQPERHPHDAAHQGMHVFKPEPALSIVDPGIVPFVGSTLWLGAHRQTEVKFRPAQDATGLQRFGSLSPAWAAQILGPLLVILLGFSAFSAEREHGTLRQMLSLGVSRSQLLWGKALALGGGLGLVLVPAGLLAGIAVIVAAEPSARGDAFSRLLGLAAGYGAYLGIFIFLSLGVSALASSSRLALVSLLAFWIVVALVAPRSVADVSRSLDPSPSREAFNAALDADLGAATQRASLERFGVRDAFGPGVPLSRWGLALKVHDHAGYGVMDRHFDALWESYARQQRMQEWTGFLLPTIGIRAFSMGVAGTDFAEHRAFSLAAERQRRVMQDIISQDLVDHADGRKEEHFSYRASRALWARVPPFQHQPAAAGAALARNLRSLGMLTLGLLLSATLAALAVSRRRLW